MSVVTKACGRMEGGETAVSNWTVRLSRASVFRASSERSNSFVQKRKGTEGSELADSEIVVAVDLRYMRSTFVICVLSSCLPLLTHSQSCVQHPLSFSYVSLCPECGLKRLSPSIFSLLKLSFSVSSALRHVEN